MRVGPGGRLALGGDERLGLLAAGRMAVEHHQCVLDDLAGREVAVDDILPARLLLGRIEHHLLAAGVDGDVEDHLVHERLPVTLSPLQPVEEGVGQAVVAGR